MKRIVVLIVCLISLSIYANAEIKIISNNCDPDVVTYMQDALNKQLAGLPSRYKLTFSFSQNGDNVEVQYSDEANDISGLEKTNDIWSDIDKMINKLANGIKTQIDKTKTPKSQPTKLTSTQHTSEEMQFLKYASAKVTPTKQAATPQQPLLPVKELSESQVNKDTIIAKTNEKETIVNDHVQDGLGYNLAGRTCRYYAKPSNDFKQEGKVVVNFNVDSDGNVISASACDGTTVSDYSTLRIALKAARETKFSPSTTELQTGTITYIFKFK